tara:strand:+ start:8423 stop:8641 length:219 start_codon:yes stop_codon:yes gene_type:complete
MRLRTIILLLIISLITFFSFLLLRLNQADIPLDVLFKEIEINLGVLVLSSFLSGFIVCLVLELAYFYKRKKD